MPHVPPTPFPFHRPHTPCPRLDHPLPLRTYHLPHLTRPHLHPHQPGAHLRPHHPQNPLASLILIHHSSYGRPIPLAYGFFIWLRAYSFLIGLAEADQS